MYKKTIYWFKRDLRIDDNKAFNECCKKSEGLIPIFIFDHNILEKYKSYDSRLGFIIDCVENLTIEINKKGGNLFCFYGDTVKVFDYLISKYKIEAVFTNKSFSWTREEIEKKVEIICKKRGVNFYAIPDNFLCFINKIPYEKVFTNFYKKWKNFVNTVIFKPPQRINFILVNEPDIFKISKNLKFCKNKYWSVNWGIKRLRSFKFKDYEEKRNRLDIDGTSKLSPYIRFGIVSLRKILKEVTEQSGKDNLFIKELAWREFWYHIKINFSGFKDIEFQEKRRNLKWENNEKFLDAFINAKTGYPIIDAAIIQLKEENWIHNRLRMILANFLTKDLLIDWRIGEEFFKQYLIDYDEVVNVGNWQWCTSVGPDPKPFRIFNPVIQSQKFDPYAKFIKKYLPELKKIPSYMLHNPLEFNLPYYKPIINHFERIKKAKSFYLSRYWKIK
ncbi:MAG: DNA photolyase family protein [Candidatus Omnitrophica bacterium]|nr:DNA photolyase family protein [Candidatus Omnitrophota bacterium]